MTVGPILIRRVAAMGYRRKIDHHSGSRIGQIKLGVLFFVQWPASAIGQKIEIISISTILQNVVRAPETENVTVFTTGPIH
jgi:hypothetical protein